MSVCPLSSHPCPGRLAPAPYTAGAVLSRPLPRPAPGRPPPCVCPAPHAVTHAPSEAVSCVGQSVSLTTAQPPAALPPGGHAIPALPRPWRSRLPQRSPPPSLPSRHGPGGAAVTSHPVRLSGRWPRPPGHLSRLSPEPCVLHLPCGLCVGWGLGAGPGSIWVDSWGLELELAPGNRGLCQVGTGWQWVAGRAGALQGGRVAVPGGSENGWGQPRSPGLHGLGRY